LLRQLRDEDEEGEGVGVEVAAGRLPRRRSQGDRGRKVRPGGGGRLSFTDLSGAADQDLSVSLVGSNLHVFSVAELREATRGFVSGNFLGEGGFGPVYKGFVADGVKKGLRPQAIAVKLWDPEGAQGHKEWLVRAVYSSPLLSSPLLPCVVLPSPIHPVPLPSV